MNRARYKVEYVPGRNFNYMPFSVKDAAVCYFLDVKPMNRWEQRVMTVLLAAEDEYGFSGEKIQYEREKVYIEPVVVVEAPPAANPPAVTDGTEKRGTGKRRTTLMLGTLRTDVTALREIVNKVDEHIYTEKTPSEEELKKMEAAIDAINARYNSVLNTF
jgi:hypothetical protein